jgi:hypothetical protein
MIIIPWINKLLDNFTRNPDWFFAILQDVYHLLITGIMIHY